MSGAHGHALYVHAASPLHSLAPQVKIACAFLVVFAIVSTAREEIWAFVAYAFILGSLAAIAKIPLPFLLSRMLVATPFLILALLFPIIGPAPDVEVLGVWLSEPGLWDMWNLLVKSLLGLLTVVILGATTEVADLLRGLGALRVPPLVTSILGFMVRYFDVILSDFSRMRLALASRGHQARGIRDWGPYGKTTGAMFIRTYERGERIYLAMESRGYSGEMPASSMAVATLGAWALGLGLALAFWLISIGSRVMT